MAIGRLGRTLDAQARRGRAEAGHRWTRGRQRLRPGLAAAEHAEEASQSTLSQRRSTARITPGIIAAWPTAMLAPGKKPLQRDLPERESQARHRVHARGTPGHE